MIKTVQIRIIAPDEATAKLAIAALQNSVGSARIALAAPHKGRRGDEYLTYGTFQIDDETTLTIEAPAAATGPTTRLAATGPTKRLRRSKP
jgi:hypothetical protein